ncbi:MAG: hypothetical protein ACI9DF_003343 [Verrucomicrobiales bacterium]|jgi:hypothetical protein
MTLWNSWYELTSTLRPAFSRYRTFLWFLTVLAAFSLRPDLRGVTSFVRGLGLNKVSYDSLLHFFHSTGIDLDMLSRLWLLTVLRYFPVHLIDQRPVLVLDGLKNPKEGRKMPAVKHLHQQSESNTKPHFIMGHSFQAFGVLCRVGSYYFCVPVCARIHEGIVVSNRSRKTLIDKACALLKDVCQELQFILLADAYYANGKMIGYLGDARCDLVTRVRSNSVAFMPAIQPEKPKRGRPKKYGKKIALNSLFASQDGFEVMRISVYGERNVEVRYRVLDLLWKPTGGTVRFVLIDHPRRGRMILLCTDLTRSAEDIVLLYSLRFKIEVSFKHAIHSIGTFGYHFWMADMKPLKRKSGNQYLHHETPEYRAHVHRKMRAYHLFVQCGTIAQGMLNYLAMIQTERVWESFGSWIRTIRPDVLPSEAIVSDALKNTLPEFLQCCSSASIWQKFILARVDSNLSEGARLAA